MRKGKTESSFKPPAMGKELEQMKADLELRLERPGESAPSRSDPAPKCSTCKDTGFTRIVRGDVEGVVTCSCVRERILDRKLAAIPAKFRPATIADVPRSDGQREFLSMMGKNPERSVFLWGDFDTGKSRMLVVQYRELVLRGVKCFYRTSDELVEELQEDATIKGGRSEILEEVGGAPPGRFHLLWDDCDKVDWDRTPFRREAVYTLLNRIYQGQLGLSVTTNYTLEELAQPAVGDPKLPQSVISRIERICRGNFLEI